MSLATRCTSCATVFRVVQDQLKVSEGWVRCGRCNEVFNAQANLVELDADGQPLVALAGASAETEAGANNLAAAPGLPAPADPDLASPALDAAQVDAAPEQAEQAALTLARDTLPATEAELDDLARPKPHDASWPEHERLGVEHVDIDLDALPGELPPDGQPDGIDAVLAGVPVAEAVAAGPDTPDSPDATGVATTVAADLYAEPADTPSFIRQADRAARWQRPGVRHALGLAACLLALALAAQWLLHQRDWVAAHWAFSRPWLEGACKLAACQIQPLRNVELLSVESTALTRIEGSPLYRMAMVLRNRADTELMMPAIDLALTDAQGQIISRRVLSAAELGNNATVVAAGTDVALQAMLSTGSRRVAGYTIEVFYP